MQQPLSPNRIGTPLVELQSVDSTNNYARELLHAGLAYHGTTVITGEQTAGKGQRGKAWKTEKGQNILMSVIIDPRPLVVAQQFGLIAASALAAHAVFSRHAGEKTSIKWPNDLYWQDRKAGGILVESGIGTLNPGEGEMDGQGWKWAIVGIGININQLRFPPDLPNPVSLQQVTGKEFNIADLARELCDEMEEKWTMLVNEGGLSKTIDAYNALLYCRNETVKLKKDNRVFEARILDVTNEGRLRVSHAIEESFSFGEIEWMIA